MAEVANSQAVSVHLTVDDAELLLRVLTESALPELDKDEAELAREDGMGDSAARMVDVLDRRRVASEVASMLRHRL